MYPILIGLALLLIVGNLPKKNIDEVVEVEGVTISQEEFSPTPEPSVSPTQSPQPVIFYSANDFKYPNSQQLSQLDGVVRYQSNDDPNQITDWYKMKIESQGFNSKSTAKTSVNGNVLNKLSGAKGDKKVEVEIKKSSDQQVVEITVNIKS